MDRLYYTYLIIKESLDYIPAIEIKGQLEEKYQIKVDVKTRYSSKVAKAMIIQNGDCIKIEFDEPQRALTPGQSAVFYIDDIVVGGGKIL